MSGARNLVVLSVEDLEAGEEVVLLAHRETTGAVFLAQFVDHDEIVSIEGLELTSKNFGFVHIFLGDLVKPGR